MAMAIKDLLGPVLEQTQTGAQEWSIEDYGRCFVHWSGYRHTDAHRGFSHVQKKAFEFYLGQLTEDEKKKRRELFTKHREAEIFFYNLQQWISEKNATGIQIETIDDIRHCAPPAMVAALDDAIRDRNAWRQYDFSFGDSHLKSLFC